MIKSPSMPNLFSEENYIVIRDLSFSYGDKIIFKDVNLNIPKKKITGILGPSGTGKTTLLRLITAQISPDTGSILVNGEDIHQLSRKALFVARREMGLLFQSGALFTGLSVFENVAFPLTVHTDLPEEMIRDLVLLKLEAVGLRGAANLMPNELSGGMARRVALARAIALDPQLILYDEPFAGQDPISMGVLVKLISLLNTALGSTSIIVSHDVKEVFSIAHYIYILSGASVIGEGTPLEIAESDSPEIRQFIDGLPDGPVPFHYPAPDYSQQLLNEISTEC
jgi:phospholipid/cholesterol/gamma-HCH transport system ATP-binding protein